jgi:ABC-type transport system involved in cytochrome c biogenesis permease subunit
MFATSYVLLWLAFGLYIALIFQTQQRLGWVASALTALSWLSLTVALVARGVDAGHWPLTNRYEFAWCFVWSILLVYLLLELRWRERRCGGAVLGIALLLATYALLRPADEKAIRPLLPALRSVWLQIHVLTAAVGYGACAVGAGLALMQLFLPAEEVIERNVERVIGWGFPWLTLGLLTGAIWAQDAWGRYWGWDPKETWTLVIWLWYLLLLHIRGLPHWRGKRMAWLALAGFGIILFALAGLPWLLRTVRLESLHGF